MPPDEVIEDLTRRIEVLESREQILRRLYESGYAIQAADFDELGRLMREVTLSVDRPGLPVIHGGDAIRDRYRATNKTYPGHGRAAKEIYHNIIVDVDPGAGTAQSLTSYTVAMQVPDSGAPFELLVAGRYEDRWRRVEGDWVWTHRHIAVEFMNDLDRHMHPGTQPYN